MLKITIYALSNLKIDQYLDFALETAQKTVDFLQNDYLQNVASGQIKIPKIGITYSYYFKIKIKYFNK